MFGDTWTQTSFQAGYSEILSESSMEKTQGTLVSLGTSKCPLALCSMRLALLKSVLIIIWHQGEQDMLLGPTVHPK